MTQDRFEPTGEVRELTDTDWYFAHNAVMYSEDVWLEGEYPIYRRVPHDPDTAAKVACGQLAIALNTPSNLPYTEAIACVAEAERLMRQAGTGDRSLELVTQMQELTARMQKEAPDAG